MKRIRAKITFTEDILGTAPSSPEVYREFIASKAPNAKSLTEEIESVGIDEMIEKSLTVFPRDKSGGPIFWDYQWKGFFKAACASLSICPGTLSYKASSIKDEEGNKKRAELRAYKKVIDGTIFVYPRKIPIKYTGKMDTFQRPLRGITAQGEKIALANSERIPAGATCEIEIMLLNDSHEKYINEWLEYGALRGMGQWRNASWGRFTFKYIGPNTGENTPPVNRRGRRKRR